MAFMKSDAPVDGPEEPGYCACPYCGKAIHLAKDPAAAPVAKAAPKTENAAKMPMNQLKNVIKSGGLA